MLSQMNKYSGLLTFFTILLAVVLNFVEFKAEIREVSAAVSRANTESFRNYENQKQVVNKIDDKLNQIGALEKAQSAQMNYIIKIAENSDKAMVKMNVLLDRLIYVLDTRINSKEKL